MCCAVTFRYRQDGVDDRDVTYPFSRIWNQPQIVKRRCSFLEGIKVGLPEGPRDCFADWLARNRPRGADLW